MKDLTILDDIKEFVNRQIDEAYDEGYTQGEKDGRADIGTAYNKGLEDAWECAKKIYFTPEAGGLSRDELIDIFGKSYDIPRKYSAKQAIDKIKEYEKKHKTDDEIKVGDEVISTCGPDMREYIVLRINGVSVAGVSYDGHYTVGDKSLFKKTGRKFPEMLLATKQMGGDS